MAEVPELTGIGFRPFSTGGHGIVVAKLENLRATTFLDSAAKTGLDKPSLTVYAKFEDGKTEERASFVKSDTDVYAAKAGQAGAVKVSPTEFDDMVN